MSNEDNRIGIRLKAFRKYKGLSQQELAKMAGVGYVTISRIERGEDCKISAIDKIEKALGIKLY